jgi:peptidoglycan/LPS O-acetylase OafA/YrhL
MTQRRLGWLDALRGYAALVVVCFHLSPSVLGPDRHMAIYHHIDLGKYGVLLFFLVSGYVIPLSLERHGCLRRFWIGRLFRVYPAYLVTIGAAALLGVWHGGLLAHASMLLDPLGQRGAVRVFWTLSYEMIFYLVVAGLFAWRLHRHSAWWAAGLALAALLFGPVLPDRLLGSGGTVAAALLILMAVSVGGHLAGWYRIAGAAGIGFVLLPAVNGRPTAYSTVAGSGQALLLLAVLFTGTVIYRAHHGRLGRGPATAALGTVAAALVLAQPAHATWAATVAAVAVTFAVAFAARHRPMPRPLRFLGTISYSLYLTHVLILLVVVRTLPGLAYRPVGVRLAAGVAVLALALAVAWAAYRMIERPGQRLGRWIATERAVPRTGRGEKRRGERLGSMHGRGRRAGTGMVDRMSERTERSEGHERIAEGGQGMSEGHERMRRVGAA